MSNGKDMIIHLIVGLIKKLLYKKWVNIFPKPPFRENISVKFNLSNYATKADLTNATEFDTSKLALKSNL